MTPSWLHRFLEETEAHPDSVARLEQLARSTLGPSPSLAQLPSPAPGAEDRLVQRLLAPPEPSRPLWIPVASIGAVAVVVAALILGLTTLPEPGPAVLSGPLPASMDRVAIAPGVLAAPEGEGTLEGTPQAPVIRWQSGLLRLQITPGTPLTVLTDEGTARVKGTVFTVRRDVLGTTVEVERGVVEVRCVDHAAVDLHPGDAATCLPLGASALNARARALRDSDLPAAIDAVERALALPAPSADVRGESLALRAELGFRAADPEAAREAARTYLDEGHTARELEMRGVLHWAASEQESAAGTP